MNSIDHLVAQLSPSYLWTNGTFPKIDLPRSATVEQVLASVFDRVSFEQGRASSQSILETRQVQIGGPREYTAVLVETNLGRKIVLLQHQGPRVGWWSRVYEEGTE